MGNAIGVGRSRQWPGTMEAGMDNAPTIYLERMASALERIATVLEVWLSQQERLRPSTVRVEVPGWMPPLEGNTREP